MSNADSVREIMTENETSQQLCLKHTHTHTKLIFFLNPSVLKQLMCALKCIFHTAAH